MGGLLIDGPPDSAGVRATIAAAPERLDAVLAGSAIEDAVDGIDAAYVVLLGAGIDLAAVDGGIELVGSRSTIPLTASASALPGSVDRSTVVVAVITHDPAGRIVPLVSAALDRGATVVAIGTTVALVELPESVRRIALDATAPLQGPAGRFCAAESALVTTAVLERLVRFPPGTTGLDVAAATEALRSRAGSAPAPLPMRALARRLGPAIPIVYGASSPAGVAAGHWARQLNLTAKAPAFSGSIPTAIDASLSGWGVNGHLTRQVFDLFVLRAGAVDSGPVIDGVEEILDEVVGHRHDVVAAGPGGLESLIDLLVLGDLFALEVAAAMELDPGPTGIEDLLGRVTRPAERRG